VKGVVRRIKVIERGRPREHPKGTSDHACALTNFPGEALWVTFDRIMQNFRLRMREPHPSKET